MAIDTFITELSSVIRNWPEASVKRTSPVPAFALAGSFDAPTGCNLTDHPAPWRGRARPVPATTLHNPGIASYSVNPAGLAYARELIAKRQYVLDSQWGDVQPKAAAETAYLERHGWDDYARWFLGLTDGARDETKARYAFVVGDFRRIHRSGIIACHYRAAERRDKAVELAAHDLLQLIDETSSR